MTPRESEAIFNTKREAYAYGNFLGQRYRNQPNIVWILGGDRLADERPEGIDLWRAMAEGIADGINGVEALDGQADYSTTLMTYHCFVTSARWFHNDPWIDFHMWGSYPVWLGQPQNRRRRRLFRTTVTLLMVMAKAARAG